MLAYYFINYAFYTSNNKKSHEIVGLFSIGFEYIFAAELPFTSLSELFSFRVFSVTIYRMNLLTGFDRLLVSYTTVLTTTDAMTIVCSYRNNSSRVESGWRE